MTRTFRLTQAEVIDALTAYVRTRESLPPETLRYEGSFTVKRRHPFDGGRIESIELVLTPLAERDPRD